MNGLLASASARVSSGLTWPSDWPSVPGTLSNCRGVGAVADLLVDGVHGLSEAGGLFDLRGVGQVGRHRPVPLSIVPAAAPSSAHWCFNRSPMNSLFGVAPLAPASSSCTAIWSRPAADKHVLQGRVDESL